VRRIVVLVLVTACVLVFGAVLSWLTTLTLAFATAIALTPLAPRGHRLSWLATVLVIAGSAFALRLVVGGGGRTIELTVQKTYGVERAAPADLALSERDVSIGAAAILIASGALPASDSVDFLPALSDAYDRMEEEEGEVGSTLLSTWLGAEGPERYHLYTVEPRGWPAPDRAVVFLHGYAGNFGVQCWHAARAFERFEATTYCPTVGFDGAWGTADGRRILTSVLDDLEERGIERVILVGLSAGAHGAAVLARSFARRLEGVVVISGAASVSPPARIPVLAIQGASDTMFPARFARAYATSAGARGTYAELDGGHFVFLEDWTEVRDAAERWIEHELAPERVER
jgi:pimeloyl-ACP methyl ester carboxylesterase